MSHGDEDFAALFEAQESTRTPATQLTAGQMVHGTVVDITRDTVFVDVGTRSEATVARHEFVDGDDRLTIAVGDRIRATVAQAGDRPKLVVSMGNGKLAGGDFELARDAKTPLRATVQKAVKGGLELDIGGHRCFCPASQVDEAYTPDLSVFEGQELEVLVIEVREGGRSVVVSRRALMREHRAEQSQKLLADLEQGAVVEGTVRTVQAYGAFVDIGGIEGLVHISEIAHTRIDRVEDVLSEGEKVKVQVLELTPSTDGGNPKIRLSMKSLAQAPEVPDSSDQIVEGAVSKVEPFGVFVTSEQFTGLVPTRELDLAPGADPRRSYPIGKKVQVVVVGKDNSGRVRLSMRRVADAEARSNYREFHNQQRDESRTGTGSSADLGSFGALLMTKLGDD